MYDCCKIDKTVGSPRMAVESSQIIEYFNEEDILLQ